MMMSEFIERTGYEPDADEYSLIEMAYYDFNGDKDAFCAHWVKERKAGRWEHERQLYARIADMEEELKSERNRAREEAEELRNHYECSIQSYYEPELEKLRKRLERYEADERIRKNANDMLRKFLQCGA